jgi:hypothetical protein
MAKGERAAEQALARRFATAVFPVSADVGSARPTASSLGSSQTSRTNNCQLQQSSVDALVDCWIGSSSLPGSRRYSAQS